MALCCPCCSASDVPRLFSTRAEFDGIWIFSETSGTGLGHNLAALPYHFILRVPFSCIEQLSLSRAG
ncbi:hypothetical protein Plhal304r1_c086g0169131 [Plasmopara halstedii]